jgi:uncharacterized protein
MNDKLHTRRESLKILGFGAALAGATPLHATMITDPDWPPPDFFHLRDVRLEQGPFLTAQKLDEAYLLRLEPDRMLHNFRVNAGLAPKAAVYGGWESVEPWIEIRCHGHTLGHYLTACACMFASTGDVRFKERVDYIVAELAECQAKTGGWLTAFPDGVAPLTDSLAGREFAGVPWYTTHKVLAGLRDVCSFRGGEHAEVVLLKFVDWIASASANVSDADLQKMLDREHGGVSEVLADVSAMTGDARYLALAVRFAHRALLDPLAQGRDKLDGLHANTQIPKVTGFSRIHEEGHAPEFGRAAEFFWQTVVQQRSFVTGGHGDNEHFFPTNQFADHLGSAKTMETCCTHNMLRLTRSLYHKNARSSYFDYFERALFNGILASQDPESGMTTYFQATRPGYVRLYHTPFDSFWCCTGSGMENHARYGESIYAHGGGFLYVNLFLASTLNWYERKIWLTQSTRFPDEDSTQLKLEMKEPSEFTLGIRHPAWCPVMTLTLNGRKKFVSRRPGTYYPLRRKFHSGDLVTVRTPMSLKVIPLPNAPDHAALIYGPIVLAARLGTQGLTPGSQLIVTERKSGEMLNANVDIPRWSRPLNELLANTQRVEGSQLRFATRGFDDGKSVELIPWFRLTNEHYNLYWHRAT